MSVRKTIMVDGNEAVASVAHRTNEVIAIYPITPSSGMGELADEWSVAMAQTQVDRQFSLYEQLAGITIPQEVHDGSQD